MDLKIKTLTPLWTGGRDGKVDRLQESGILGGLRWWAEVFVRGMGGQVNDPTQGERSSFTLAKYEESKAACERSRLREAGLCDVSQVFGATGWRRRFRLTILDQTRQDTLSPKQISAQRKNKKTNKKPTWWFPDHPRFGTLTFQVQSLSSDFSPEVIGGLLKFVADWAAIGAKAQMGFGVIEFIKNQFEFDTQKLYDWLVAVSGNRSYPNLPSLKNAFLARVHLPDATYQDTFNLKYDLRQLFRGDRDLRHFVMGTAQSKRVAAKVKMSRPYKNGLIRVWGWMPEEADVYKGSWDRNKVLEAIHRYLSTKYTLKVWREMNTSRDTVLPSNSDTQTFLRSLLEPEENGDAA